MAKSGKPKKRRSPVRWIIIIGMLVLVAFMYFTLSGREKKAEVMVELVEKRAIVSSVTESGVIEPVIEVAIAPDVSGEVVELNGKEGDYVHKGDLLVIIQPDNFQSALEQAQAGVDASIAQKLQAEANVEQARTKFLQDSVNYKRTNTLYKSEAVSKSDWENARLAMEVSRSQLKAGKATYQASSYQVKSSQASLKQARSNLKRTNIFATMDGTLTRQNVRTGQRVLGTVQNMGTDVLRIADLSEMQVTVNINENDIRFIKVGDSAHIEADAFEGDIFKGTVSEIGYSPAGQSGLLQAASSDQITNYEVKVLINRSSYANRKDLMEDIPSYQSPFRPGMSAQVEIFTDRQNDVVAIPIQAVTIRKPESDSTDEADPIEVVFEYVDGQVKMRPVTTGINDDTYISIEEGLEAGTQIVVGPYRMLSKELENGMQVALRKEADKSAAK